jgi:hypothetical protein
MTIMRKVILTLIVLVLSTGIQAQIKFENLSGQVSFISSQNIYVKFKSTTGISAGDTLFIPSDDKKVSALIVTSFSSTSCVCTPLSPINLKVGDLVLAAIEKPEAKNTETVSDVPEKTVPVPEIFVESADSSDSKSKTTKVKQKIRGSISLNSYSDLSNTSAENSQRFRYSISLNAENIGNSKFSIESYLSFKHKSGEWDVVKNDIFSALKIYNLALKYDINSSTRVSLGRRINPRLSSVGAIDGLQAEKSFGRFTAGAVIGFRPDYTDYGFNSDLLQYGAYIAHNSKSDKAWSESSLAFMQQFNQFKTDRRFIYFQHSNSFIKNLYFYSTLEVDLFSLRTDSINGDKPQSTFDLTGLYVSLRYKIFKNLTVFGSYDARKNVMYYETYKTFIDRMLESEIRQGFRLQANYRITRDLMLGLQSGYRYLKTDPHPSKNIYGYLTYSNIPVVNLTATLSATYLESSHLIGKVAGLSLYRDFFKGKVQSGIGYKYINYRLPENLLDIIQNMGEASLSLQLVKNISFSVNYEGTYEKRDRYDRIYVQLRKRF